MSDTSRATTDRGFNIFCDWLFWTLPKRCSMSLRSLIQATRFNVVEISVITTWSCKAWHEKNTCLVLIRYMNFRQQKTKENYHYACLDKILIEFSILFTIFKILFELLWNVYRKSLRLWGHSRWRVLKCCRIFYMY